MYLWNTSFSYKTTARKRKSIRYENWILVLFLPVVSRCKSWCVPVPLRTPYRSFVCFFPQTRALLPPLPGPGPCPKTRRPCTWLKPVYTDSGRGPLLALFPAPRGFSPAPRGARPRGARQERVGGERALLHKGLRASFLYSAPSLLYISSSTNHRLCTESPRPSALYRYLCLHCVIKRQHRLEETIYYIYKNRGCRPGLCIRIFRRRSLPDDRAAMRTTPLPPLLLHVTERASGT